MPSSTKENWYLALYQDRKFEEIIAYIAAQKSADFFELNMLATCFFQRSEFEKALAIFTKALSLSGDLKLALCNIGNCHYKLENYSNAKHFYQQALTHDQEFLDGLYNLTLCCVAERSYSQARIYIERCILLAPKETRFLPLAAEILICLNETNIVTNLIKNYEQKLSRKNCDILFATTLVARANGDLLRAMSAIEGMLDESEIINDDVANVHALTLLDLGLTYRAVEELEKLDKGSNSNLNLGVAYVDIGEFEKAKEIFNNCARMKQVQYQAVWNLGRLDPLAIDPYLKQQTKQVERGLCSKDQLIHHYFTSALNWEAKKDYGSAFNFYKKANNLQKQKGTSLEADRKTFKILKTKLAEIQQVSDPGFEQDPCFKPIFIVGMPRSGTSLLENLIATSKTTIPLGERNFVNLAIHDSGLLDTKITEEAVCQVRAHLMDAYGYYNVFDKPFIDKMPLNFLWVPIIKMALPEAKILHIKRDKMSTIWSIYSQFFQSKSIKFGNDLPQIKNFYDLYSQYMNTISNEGNLMFNVIYEELVDNPSKIASEIYKFLNLSDHFNIEKIGSKDQVFSTASNVQLRNGMYKVVDQKWKNYREHIVKYTQTH